jgi:hypothetical protein
MERVMVSMLVLASSTVDQGGNPSLILLFYAECLLEKQQMPISCSVVDQIKASILDLLYWMQARAC